MRLTAAGYDVTAVESGEQALAQQPLLHPNLIITDLQMEGMDGMTLFNQVHSRNPSLPVMILTAHGTIPEAVEATSRGVFSYLTKPFDSKILLEHRITSYNVCYTKLLRHGWLPRRPPGSCRVRSGSSPGVTGCGCAPG